MPVKSTADFVCLHDGRVMKREVLYVFNWAGNKDADMFESPCYFEYPLKEYYGFKTAPPDNNPYRKTLPCLTTQ